METNLKKTAVIYARVSSIGDRQDTERQVKDLSAYANANGYNLTKVFTEHISGAKKNADRPVLIECLAYCFDNGIDTLLLSELSRLGRDVWEVQENLKHCKDNGLNVFFQKESFTLLGADGKPNFITPVVIAILGTCAEMERENISFRLKSGRANYIANGGKLGRKEGYRKPKEQKQEEYKEVIKMLRKAKELKEAGVKQVDAYSIRGISEHFGYDENGKRKVGVSTVQRLKKEFGL